MKLIPILFSTPMVQAILEGRKTVTRRLVKGTPNHDHFGTNIMDWGLSKHPYKSNGQWFFDVQTDVDDHATSELKCKYNVGDVLWVRETWRGVEQDFGQPRFEYRATEKIDLTTQWRPSIFMPKGACRLFLQVESVTVERLQDITEEDAVKEGVQENVCADISKCTSSFCKTECTGKGEYFHYSKPMDFDLEPCYSAKESFTSLWQSINGGESWNENPFVWRIEFKKIEQPEGFLNSPQNLAKRQRKLNSNSKVG